MRTRATVAIALLAAVATGTVDAQDDGQIYAGDVADLVSLKAFVENARVHLESISTGTELANVRDAFRTEGEWKSGSLFLMVLAQDGTVVLHGDDPTAEGKQLNAIEDDRGKRVVEELLAAAGRGGDFVEYHWDDPLSSEDAGERVCYTVEYTSGLANENLVLVGGFAQDLYDVPVEIAELPRPEVTAAEVEDRDSLISFVEAAAESYREALLTEDYAEIASAKNAYRQDGGNWKSGSVYFYVISDDGVVHFHGVEQFLEGTILSLERVDINGVRYLKEIIAVGTAGSGFVDYYYHDPEAEDDEDTGSSKIGYVTGFRIPGSEQVFIVGSGIYGAPI